MAMELNREYPQLDEEMLFESMVKMVVNRMKPQNGFIRRSQHAKATGCVKGVFTIRNFIVEGLRHGVFSKANHSYQAIIRFSNSSEVISSDCKGDARGVAIKLININGQSNQNDTEINCQDFLMVNHPVFPFATPEEIVKLFQIRGTPLVGDPLALAWLTLFHHHHQEIGSEILNKIVSCPLEMSYWSCVPFWLGPSGALNGHAVKYSLVPRLESKTIPKDLSYMKDDYLREALARHLRTREAIFDFNVQLQSDAIKMPIEDASVEWDEKLSVPIPLATLTIGEQDVDSLDGYNLSRECERMFFSPWNALPEHRPMGGINRLRQSVYLASKADRISNIQP